MNSPTTSDSPPWVLVSGDFQAQGGMDKANFKLASHLAATGVPIFIVAHSVDPELKGRPGVKVVLVPRRGGSDFLSERLLRLRARQVADDVCQRWHGARVLVNGGNCDWPDINWVHCVHRAWPCLDTGAPLWFRAKNRLMKQSACKNERRAIRNAKVVIANSNRTRRDLTTMLGVAPDRIHTVYMGADDDTRDADAVSKAAARKALQLAPDRPVIIVVGALGWDLNKGHDILWNVFRDLCAQKSWNAQLLFVGGGRRLSSLKSEIASSGLADRVTILGFTDSIKEALAASDLLVSPVSYEAFGLNVHEAIVSGLPAMVTASAGVAELYPADLKQMLIQDPRDRSALAGKLLLWQQHQDSIRDSFASFSAALRKYTWKDMASQIVRLATQTQTVVSTSR
jgi:glycosyltransferase involved in cell wall biosynthesis